MFKLRVMLARQFLIKTDGFIEEVVINLRLKVDDIIGISASVFEESGSDAQCSFSFIGSHSRQRSNHFRWSQSYRNTLPLCQLAQDFMSCRR